jgi:hypothetical protein
MVATLALIGAAMFPLPAREAWLDALPSGLPSATLTPDALNPVVTQADVEQTVCGRGWTRDVRPPEWFTEKLKRWQIRQYGYGDWRLRNYEEDHLIPLKLGGSPTSPRNLWSEPHRAAGGWGSRTKDRLENRLRALVCRGALTLDAARAAIRENWIAAYRRYVGSEPRRRTAERWRAGD